MPTCLPGSGSAPQCGVPCLLRLLPWSSTVHSTLYPDLTSRLTSASPPQPTPTLNSLSLQTPPHLHIQASLHINPNSSTSPAPPHPTLTSHNHQTLDRGPQALPSGLSRRLPSQHPVNTPPSRAALSSTSQHLSCHVPSRRPQFCAFPMWLPASSFSDATP